MRGSNGPSLPRAASSVSAPAITAASNSRSAPSSASSASAVDTCVPLISASPSLAASCSGRRPARSSPCAAGMRTPPWNTSPSPISGRHRWASGARSPDAPTDPWQGMTGSTSRLWNSSSASTTSSRAPEKPRARLAALSSSTRRTTRGDSGSPTPTACERSRLSCSRSRSAAGMRVVASLPKPVLTPYTGASPSAARRTTSALARMPARQAGASRTVDGALPASRRSCATSRPPGTSSSGVVMNVLPDRRCARKGWRQARS